MATPRSAWGIDIGNRALKAIRLVRDGSGALRVDDFEVIEHETLLSNAGDNRDSLISTALANFIARHPSKGETTAVSVSGSTSLARFIPLPPVEPSKIPEIVRFEAIQQIPFPLDEVEWSYQLFQKPDSPDVEVGIFAMKKELVNAHMKHFTDVGLDVEVVQLNPLAVYNAMFHDDRLKATTMIIDLGSENTDLIIADGETIWLRSIPVGGKAFTEILAKQFKLSFTKAEELKRTAATSKYAKQIFQAMRPIFADLVAEVQRSIGFYASVHRDSRIKKVLALGGTFRLPGLQKYLQQNLQLDVARIDHLAAGGPADAKARAVFDENLLSMASAYGLAIQAMGQATITSSLLPAHIRQEKLWRDKAPWFAAAAACFLAGAGIAMGSYFLQKTQYDQNASQRQAITSTLAKATALSNSWKSNVEDQGTDARMRVANLQTMVRYRDIWPGLYDQIISTIPKPKAPSGERPTRDTIVVDVIGSSYSADLSKVVLSGVPAAGAGAAPPPPPPQQVDADGNPVQQDPTMAPAAPQVAAGAMMLQGLPANLLTPGTRGFVLAVDVITPFAGESVAAHKFLDEGYVAALNKLKETTPPTSSFTIVYAEVTNIQKLGDNGPAVGRMRARMVSRAKFITSITPVPDATGTVAPPAGGAGFRPGGFNAPTPVQPYQPFVPQPLADPNALLDPVSNEDMTNDSVAEIMVVVTLLDATKPPPPAWAPPAPPAPPAPTASAGL